MTRKLSLTERAYRQLHHDLVTCRLTPGERINIKELADRDGYSSGAIREALARLSSEGFVTFDEKRGFRASSVTIRDMLDLVDVRISVEVQCLRRAMECGNVGWEANIVATQHRLSRTPERHLGRLSEDYATAHAAFHAAIVAACDNNWLLRMREWLYAQSERYRYLASGLPDARRDLVQEHGALAQAVLERDTARAAALIEEHLASTARGLAQCPQFHESAVPEAQRAGLKTLLGPTFLEH